jgi:hypothetical protein
MFDFLNNFLILLILALIFGYVVISFLGFISYFSVSNPRERYVFLRVFLIPLGFVVSLLITLVSYYSMDFELVPVFSPKTSLSSTYVLISGAAFSILPALIVYINSKFQTRLN